MQSFRFKIYCLLVFFSFCLSKNQAQDSLQQLLQTDIPDTTRIDLLGDLSKSLFGPDPDQSIIYAKEAVELAKKIGDIERQGAMLKNVGIGYYYKGEFLEVLSYWRKSLTAYERINHPKGISNLLSNIGAVYNSTGDNTKALDYFLRALRIAEAHGDDFRRATVLQNIGAVHSNMEQFALSETYYVQALKLCDSLQYDKGIATVTMNLGEVYKNFKKYDKATTHVDKAKRIFTKLKDPSLPEAMVMASLINFEQNNYREAQKEAQNAYRIAKATDNKTMLQKAIITKGRIYNAENQTNLSIPAFREGIKLGQTIGVNNDLKVAYEGLVDAYRKTGRFNLATIAQDSLLKVNQQIYNLEKDKKISNLQLEFNLEKRETEISLLNADNALKNQQIEQAKIQRNFLSAIAAFLILLIGGMGYLYQYANKKNRIISEEKNKSDRLLKNILPPETAEELKRNGVVQPKSYEQITVLFTDFVGFTQKASAYSPEIIVSSIDYYFKQFDKIVAQNDLEKIKTMGDAYMCAGGLHTKDKNQVLTTTNTINAAAQILQFVEQTAANLPEGIVPFQIRIGIDSGPVVAGVVGQSKFQYDIWEIPSMWQQEWKRIVNLIKLTFLKTSTSN